MAFGNLTDQLAILRRQDLTSTEKLVAVVALSFRNSESGRCNPPIVSDDVEKETLCSRSGYTKQCVTKTLASLEAKGVLALKKTIARPSEITFTVNDVYGKRGLPSTTITATVNDVYGKGKRCLPITDKEQIKNRQVLIDDFQPHAQDEVAPTMGVTPTVNPSPHDGQGVAPTMGLTGSPHGGGCKRKEKRKEKESSKTYFSIPRPEDVPEQLWADFVTHRKAKKAPITETVIKRTRSEAAKCSMTLSQAIEMMVARGWQGFEARFVLKDTTRNPFCPNYREATPAPNPAHNPFIPRRAKTPEELQAEKEQREAEELFGGLFR